MRKRTLVVPVLLMLITIGADVAWLIRDSSKSNGIEDAAKNYGFNRIQKVLEYLAVGSGAVGASIICGMLGSVAIRKRRQRGGICVRCKYDLRASAGRCPECGLLIASNLSEPSAKCKESEKC